MNTEASVKIETRTLSNKDAIHETIKVFFKWLLKCIITSLPFIVLAVLDYSNRWHFTYYTAHLELLGFALTLSILTWIEAVANDFGSSKSSRIFLSITVILGFSTILYYGSEAVHQYSVTSEFQRQLLASSIAPDNQRHWHQIDDLVIIFCSLIPMINLLVKLDIKFRASGSSLYSFSTGIFRKKKSA